MADTNEEKMRAVTIRFTESVYDAIDTLANEFDVSIATVVRLAVDNNLAKYLGDLKYINKQQGNEINSKICKATDEFRDIATQLRRIGINYNQELKMKHIEAKDYSDFASEDMIDSDIEKRALAFQKNVMTNMKSFDKDELEKLMMRYEKATESLGEALWHIRG